MLGFIGDSRAAVLNNLARIIGSNKRYIGDDYIGTYQVAKKDSPSLAEDLITLGTAFITVKNRGKGVFTVKTSATTLTSIRTIVSKSLKGFKDFDYDTFFKTAGKGIDKYGYSKCKEFGNDLWDVIGGDLKKIDLKNGGLSHFKDGKDIGVSTTGVHYFLEKVIEGKTYIFDNVYRKGILKADYEKSLEGYNGSRVPGSKLMEDSKTIKSMDDLNGAGKNSNMIMI